MSASNYRACLKETLKYEGGYVNDPRDPGGETNFGVTKATARANGYTGPMKTIPMVPVVEGIYRNKFWKSGSGDCDKLADGVDLATFDFAVHSGPSRAWKYLKASLGGPPVETVKKLCRARTGFLQSLKIWATYKKGFTSRMASVEAVSVKMALAAAGKAPEAVQKELQKEAKAQTDARNKDVVKAGGTTAGSTGAATGASHGTPPVHTPDTIPAPDASSFDWHTLLYVGLGIAAFAVVAYFVVSAINNHKRAAAYAAAAKAV